MTTVDVAIVGGGAAGLMCAIEAGKRRRRVLVLERAERVGKKILISGGGHCNFTNLYTSPDNFSSNNPHFCKSALARFGPGDFLALVERYGIAYHEKERGQIFCDLSAHLIVDLLLAECRTSGVRIQTDCEIGSIEKRGNSFWLETSQGPVDAASLVIATGGRSIPKLGATGFGYEVATRFGHRLVPTRAGLVPLTVGDDSLRRYQDLSGVGLPVEASANGQRFDAGMLFTHRGLSGPAILQISSYWRPGDELRVNLVPGQDLFDWLARRRRERPDLTLGNALAELLPKRLAQRLVEGAFENRPLRQYPEPGLRAIADQLQSWNFQPAGTEGYRSAEVTVGGVDTGDLSSTTLASRKVPGLYFVGEVVDVTGQLGGFNFQWAWASGYAAGQVA